MKENKLTVKQLDEINTSKPIFVVGVDRSGTTLLNMMLDAHPDLFITYEVRIILDYYSKLATFGDLTQISNRKKLILSLLSEPKVIAAFPQVSLNDFNLDKDCTFSDIICQLYGSALKQENKQVWGDKDPMYTEHIEKLNHLFPHSKFIHIVRDGRDVAISLKSKSWGANTFVKALKFWERLVTTNHRMLKMLTADRYVEIRYEDLVTDSEKTLIKICNCLGIQYHTAMLESYSIKAKQNDVVGTKLNSIHANLSAKPDISQLYKWKNTLSKSDKAIAAELSDKALMLFNYEVGQKSYIFKPFKKIYYILQEWYKWRFKK
jgi:hypothetical protein